MVEICGREPIYESKSSGQKTYSKYFLSRGGVGCVDVPIVLEKFSDILREEIQKKLLELEAVFIPHRSFCVYVGVEKIEKEFKVPVFGNRFLLRAEEREGEITTLIYSCEKCWWL